MCTGFAAAVEHPAVLGRRAEYKQCVCAGDAGCCVHFQAHSQVHMPLKHSEQVAMFLWQNLCEHVICSFICVAYMLCCPGASPSTQDDQEACEEYRNHQCRAASEAECKKHAAAFCTALFEPMMLLS